VAVNSNGDVVVLDARSGWLDRFSSTGQFLGKFGPATTRLGRPQCIAVDSTGDYLVATDGGELQKYDAGGTLQQRVRVWNPLARRPVRWVSVAVDPHGSIYVVDAANGLLTAYDTALQVVANVRLPGIHPDDSAGVAVASDYSLYVTLPATHQVVHTSLNGDSNTIVTNQVGDPGQLDKPVGVATGPDGRIFIAEEGLHRIFVFTP
jgi:glucose/arabinose dehydrogenase